jgi:alcohol dehydrogenase class IV
MLPAVLHFNHADPAAREIYNHYGELLARRGYARLPVTEWVDGLLALARLPSLESAGVAVGAIRDLASDATRQWTGQFNPRTLREDDYVLLYDQVLNSVTTETS